ncbi:MAG: hypothetical protein U0990_09500 [Candidatus Nanopelagicales bacterium]|nr:hypothetical protein [Candidatus Nanopelagicales bacterium]
MKRQELIELTGGIYAGQVRSVDFDIAARVIANGMARPAKAEVQIHPVEAADDPKAADRPSATAKPEPKGEPRHEPRGKRPIAKLVHRRLEVRRR